MKLHPSKTWLYTKPSTWGFRKEVSTAMTKERQLPEKKRLVLAAKSDLSQVSGSTAMKAHFKFNLLTQRTLLKNRRKAEPETELNYCGLRSFLICDNLCIYFLKSSESISSYVWPIQRQVYSLQEVLHSINLLI